MSERPDELSSDDMRAAIGVLLDAAPGPLSVAELLARVDTRAWPPTAEPTPTARDELRPRPALLLRYAAALVGLLFLAGGLWAADARIHPSPVAPPPAGTSDMILPIQALLEPMADDLGLMLHAENLLRQHCMESRGFDDLDPLVADTDELFDFHRHRYGDVIDDAATLGYRPANIEQWIADAQRAAQPRPDRPHGYDEALFGGTQLLRDGSAVPDGSGCSEIAAAALYGNGDDRPPYGVHSPALAALAQLQEQSYFEMRASPEVAAAEEQWRSCMEASGYSYRSSDGGFAQYGVADWSRPPVGPPPAAEINTAIADAACRRESRLTQVQFEVESTIQHRLLAENSTLPDELAAANIATIGRALDVVGATSPPAP